MHKITRLLRDEHSNNQIVFYPHRTDSIILSELKKMRDEIKNNYYYRPGGRIIDEILGLAEEEKKHDCTTDVCYEGCGSKTDAWKQCPVCFAPRPTEEKKVDLPQLPEKLSIEAVYPTSTLAHKINQIIEYLDHFRGVTNMVWKKV